MEEKRPRVIVCALIWKEGRVLLGLRHGAIGEGEWATPGGYHEGQESFEEAALREIREECGVTVCNARFQMLANIANYPPHHFVGIGIEADWESGEPEIREPDRCKEWRWCDPESPPGQLTQMTSLAIQSSRTGQTYYDRDEATRLAPPK